ncbi:bifunctional tRNA (5-methylaminomethyl-2-thiouridine)(34)-methyltransferase MnmD/FAD-dependent 5-carboxymethylaminomethyl-2-thiouridine(34) oxidoreductase MnmC [Marinomonas spartinae]|uniref:bifunctional tRNA (5-methylaminomethyl-2-thiouridine)(34)-methyltransferase MnmD/FAD-dependent 5-carboxymethylaminomethyl-2-thiouridine(34) oxidoreductase MnmC n=1 Tax=Marinomonas spartinae TaxID=1792290 RepID=UPI0018F214F1|nr:bifunctional tRNA (5-methylaminomethyl-2-thiouridine)(34)-methyltransferase MnmD/FAD-dependent 5-carboxymethylaminomethyl-2-thiouridine(34) oxidoreductase MnmC [Marinomonas spartinae]MBJ7555267.1 bifunctional tRNA (5-methylaminomethyl-2-thiouridine)(34)-methyltransferase MnmD/FAD-dependent 5-carboxymethylaminomethyl-2-thiouridine(34) oxidoreductase MnmC [Marinomonas spartinae]
MLTSYRLAPPTLTWGEDGAPHSNQFDDVYFDKEAGLEETRYVFLQHNHLSERWKNLTTPSFAIAETGFGTGLNFLCAWQAFIEQAPVDTTLHFISVEKFPLSREQLINALKMWPSLANQSQELIKHYPQLSHGFHRIELAQGRIQLTLWFGEAQDGLSELNADIDAWFLDGFAPSKNPDMWSPSLFKHINRLSHQGTTFATFTAAGIVRRGLQDVGFEVRKVKGFGHKREMAVGELNQSTASFPERMVQGQAWFNVRSNHPHAHKASKHVLVVGSGLAGATTAASLAHQGIKVTVWEQGREIACQASGNPQGMLYPKLSSQDTTINRFYLAAYLFAARLYSTLDENKVFWDQCGLIQRPNNEKERARFATMLASELYPDTVMQAKQDEKDSLFLPLSGWVVPTRLCETLLSHKNIEVQLNTQLVSLNKAEHPSLPWQASHQTGTHAFSDIVFCTANDTNRIDYLPNTPAYPIRGQVSYLPLEAAQDACEDQNELHTPYVICQEGYVSPALEDTFHFGATYDLKDQDENVREEGHARNLRMLETLLKLKANTLKVKDCGGRVSFRCAIPDYTPMVGPVFNPEIIESHYATLSKNAKWKSDKVAQMNNGLFLNIGHGSRGLVSTPLSACYLTSLITGEAAPIEQRIINRLHPSRFIVRDLKRQEAVQNK